MRCAAVGSCLGKRLSDRGLRVASVDEASGAVSAAVSKSDETDAAIGSAASTVDELTSALQGAGVEDRAAMSEDAKSKLDEAASQQAAAKQSLEQALAILNGIKGLLTGGSAPVSLKHQDMASGEQLVARSRETATDKGNRRARLMRAAMQRAYDVEDASKTVSNNLTIQFPDPPPRDTQAVVSVPSEPPTTIHKAHDQSADLGAGVAAVLMTALAAKQTSTNIKKAFGNMVDKRRRRRESD